MTTMPKPPSEGGCFIRNKDGTLTRVDDQPAPRPAEERSKPPKSKTGNAAKEQ